MTIEKLPAASKEVQEVIACLDQALLERYEASDIHGIDGEEFDRAGAIRDLSDDSRSIGCGAFRPLDRSVAEVKRMFIERAYRGREWQSNFTASRRRNETRGFETSVLETGIKQPEAIGLYRSMDTFLFRHLARTWVANTASASQKVFRALI